jgi:flavin reductase (DIM6/NTAB) family NADH-FMN oxidoreductase RutF
MEEPMQRQPISTYDLIARSVNLFHTQWFLLTSGDFAAGDFNCMVISWGSLGEVWNRALAQVFVRPGRYTYQFMEKYPSFTLCAFPEKYRANLNYLGNKSGRDENKLAVAKLTPEKASLVAAPVYAEAELAIECRKMYWQDLDPAHFLNPGIEKSYPSKDYHRVYFGEIVAVTGVEAYLHKEA